MSDRLRVAVIGFGNHVRKNMLRLFDVPEGPVLKAIFVRDKGAYATAYPELADRFTDQLEVILGDDTIDALYCATPISSHCFYATAGLNAGKHILCEKPLALNLAEATSLSALAEQRGLFLGEVAMYQFHAQFRWIKALLREKRETDERLLGIRARFSIPALAAGDIRYNPELGGGALLDVGFYPLSLVAALMGSPDSVAAVGHISSDLKVDLSGQALLTYGDVGCHCFWAIGASYANEVELSFTNSTYLVPRAFSKPPELATEILVIGATGQRGGPIAVPADDQFLNIFSDYAAAIAAGDQAFFAERRENAVLTAKLIESVRSALVA